MSIPAARITGAQILNADTYLTFYQRRERQVIEQIGEELPHVGVAVLAQALIIEAVPEKRMRQREISCQNRTQLSGGSDTRIVCKYASLHQR